MEIPIAATRARWWRSPIFWGGLIVVLATQAVYLETLTISCPFWDSGEFIATSYTLGIPHPPGTPLYVLIGRVFSLIPISEISARVNYLSAFGSTLCALFTFLVIVKLTRRWQARREVTLDRLIAVGAGIAGAFFTAFGRTFWDNAVEAEVYALSSFVMVLSVYLVLCWEESGPPGKRNNNLLLLVGYLLFVSIGIHMGTFLVTVPIFAFVLLVSPRTVFPWDFWGTVIRLGVTLVLMLVLSLIGLGSVMAVSLGMVFLLALIAYRVWSAHGARNLALWFGALAIVGLSVQLFLIVRANLDPMINEADPHTWENLWLVLSRDQYKPPNPFELRQAPWDIQFTKHFWRYWHDQYHLGFRPEWLAMAVPFLLGIVGMVAHFLKDRVSAIAGQGETRPLTGLLRSLSERRRFVFMFLLMFFTTIFLVFYLNFRENEVRDRDYFFVAAYHFFTIWMGLGMAAIAHWLRGDPKIEDGRVIEPSGGRLFGVGTVVIFCILSLLPVRQGWHAHDRTDFMVARDYAYNMLVPLGENAIIFTNGDNDTFPLWYLQEVEKIRTDVRVVNLSLLNTHWYIRQLRDYEPTIDIGFRDDEIDRLHGFYDRDGTVVMVKDIMVQRILTENLDERPIYLAVTVPEQMGLENYLVMEGLVFRIDDEEGDPERLDVERTWTNLREVFLYRGLLDEEGYYDESVYKDENSRKLIQNYVAAYVRLAHHFLRGNNDERALEALDYAHRINPAFPGVLYTRGYLMLERERYQAAEEAFSQLIELGDDAPEVFRLLGTALEGQERYSEAEAIYREAIRRHPENFDAYRVLFSYLWAVERKDEAVALIQSWLDDHPDDELTRQALRELMIAPADSAAPLPGDTGDAGGAGELGDTGEAGGSGESDEAGGTRTGRGAVGNQEAQPR